MSLVSETLKQELLQLYAQRYDAGQKADAAQAAVKQLDELIKTGNAMLHIATKAESVKEDQFAARIAADVVSEVVQ
jgi:hypothetical protein